MFTADDILARTRWQPFEPFRIVTSIGQTYDILHPDQAFTTRRQVIVPLPTEDGLAAVPDRYSDVSLLHITEIQQLPVSAGPSANGPA